MRHSVHLQAGGSFDPEAARSGEILAEYFRLEDVRAICGSLRRRFLLAAAGWAVAAAVLPALRIGLGDGLVVLAAAALGTMVVEWRAASHLNRSLDSAKTFVSRTSTPPPRQDLRG